MKYLDIIVVMIPDIIREFKIVCIEENNNITETQ